MTDILEPDRHRKLILVHEVLQNLTASLEGIENITTQEELEEKSHLLLGAGLAAVGDDRLRAYLQESLANLSQSLHLQDDQRYELGSLLNRLVLRAHGRPQPVLPHTPENDDASSQTS